ncbi:hypothetical protein [Actinomadura sp. 6N118]|uniref:hypothetical protein n=1 Tax=Actinomadura sp. 6N118 TaxID=3375151 RepID=UPI00379CFEBE
MRTLIAGALATGACAATALALAAPAQAQSTTVSGPTSAVRHAAAAAPATPAQAAQPGPEAMEPMAAPRADAKGTKPPKRAKCYTWKNVFGKRFGDGCFDYKSDDVWVRDRWANGLNFRVHTRNSIRRHNRYCKSTGGNWRRCRYNYEENGCVRMHGYHPPHVVEQGWSPAISVKRGTTTSSGKCSV